MLKQGRERCEEILTRAGAGEVRHIPLLQGAGFHLMGTARMGEDPKRFVTNEWGATTLKTCSLRTVACSPVQLW